MVFSHYSLLQSFLYFLGIYCKFDKWFLQGSLGLLAVSPASLVVLGFVIYEHKLSGSHCEKKQVRGAIFSSRSDWFILIWEALLVECEEATLLIIERESD